jgi:hypothetical protein
VPRIGEQAPSTQNPSHCASIVHGFGPQVPFVQVKLTVQSLAPLQLEATQRCVPSQVRLGPQSLSLVQPGAQWFSGCAPPWLQVQGLPQM